MVQLKVLTAQAAPIAYDISTFPCRIGRAASADLRLEAPGVWEEHLEIFLDEKKRFVAQVCGGALASVNGSPAQSCVLRNGDVLDLGAVKLQFWLGKTRQRNFQVLEALTWVVFAVLSLTQIALIYAMLR